jgi:hypothetical protein
MIDTKKLSENQDIYFVGYGNEIFHKEIETVNEDFIILKNDSKFHWESEFGKFFYTSQEAEEFVSNIDIKVQFIEEVVKDIEYDLNDRRGLHINNLDEEIQQEIKDKWRTIVESKLSEYDII